MILIQSDLFNEFAKGISFDLPTTSSVISFFLNPTILVIALILIGLTIFTLFYLKRVITNSVLGGVVWAIGIYFFKLELPLIPSFVISILMGPAGFGTMLLLKFFGLLV